MSEKHLNFLDPVSQNFEILRSSKPPHVQSAETIITYIFKLVAETSSKRKKKKKNQPNSAKKLFRQV